MEENMLSKNLASEINTQIKLELYSAYLYLSMAAYFESENLPGFASWMKKQAGEEQEHALKFFEYLNDRGIRLFCRRSNSHHQHSNLHWRSLNRHWNTKNLLQPASTCCMVLLSKIMTMPARPF